MTGDSGHGLTHGTIAGLLLTDLICGRSNPWEKLYDPSPSVPRWATGEFLKENFNTAFQYGDWLKTSQVDSAQDIACGQGAVLGPEVLGALPEIKPLPASAFRKALEAKAGVLIDTRDMLAFGGGHIEGALNIGAAPMLSLWAGWLLDPEQPILLVVDDEKRVPEVVRLFLRTG